LRAWNGSAKVELGKNMQGNHSGLDSYVSFSASALGLAIEPEWKTAIIANLDAIFKIAALLDGFELPDDIEPAPVFEA
jgi:hypothetical protein